MTITYQDGIALKAIVLSQTETEIRAIPEASSDALILTLANHTWVTEDLEPVASRFDWEQVGAPPVPAIEDCVCAPDLAATLIRMLYAGSEADDSAPALASPTDLASCDNQSTTC
jgi:hypothetical protein